MNRLRQLFIVLSISAASTLGGGARAAQVWDELPDDALGAVVVHDLERTDAAVQRLLGALQVPLGRPLTLVKAATGINEGLDPDGDLLVAALPGRGGERRPTLAVWLPVSDYDRFVRSLHGTPREEVTAVTMAGEDLLVARHGEWAVVVDPDVRGRLDQLVGDRRRGGRPVPAAWGDWVGTNDVTIMLFRPGVRRGLSEVLGRRAAGELEPEVTTDETDRPIEDDLFGTPARDIAANPWQAARAALHAGLGEVPEATRWLRQTVAIGVGLQLDDQGNATVAARLAWQAGTRTPDEPGGDAAEPAPLPYDGGAFVVAGAGRVSGEWVAAVSGPYTRLLASDLGVDVREQAAAVEKLRKSLTQAGEGVTSFAVFSRPGKRTDGVYTNSHLVLRVKSAQEFVERAAGVIARWNELAEHAPEAAQLRFQSEPVQIAGRDATQYYVDMADMVGAAGLPEVRQSMERLFGPGGRLRLELVAIDDRTVLVAAATVEQAAEVVELVAKGAPPQWDQEELQPTAGLLGGDPAWRVFLSPRSYVARRNREVQAIVGPAFGPQPMPFPSSPPLAVAGGETADGVWVELIVPADTVTAMGHYVHD